MKKIVFPFLSIAMLGLSGCFKSGDNIQTFPEMPAVVDFYTSPFQPMIITPYGSYFAPDLLNAMGTDLNDEDAIWTTFSINYDQQPASAMYYTVSDMEYIKVGKSDLSTSSGDDFNAPIEDMQVIWRSGNVLFFFFRHTAPADQKYIYEMTYDYTDPSVAYIRAKENGTGLQQSGTFVYLYAFDIQFFRYNNKEFNMMYYTGVDEEGNDVYKPWSGNPYEIDE